MTYNSQLPAETARGHFERQASAFANRLSADGSSGWAAEPGRYHLYVSLACPWAHRAVIVRQLKGLQDVVSMSVVDPLRDERGWAFREGRGHGTDPVNGFAFLAEAYAATDPAFAGRFTVPTLWDRQTHRIATNGFRTLDADLATQFDAHAEHPDVDLYPAASRDEIDALDEVVYDDVNNGVYKAGFAGTQEAYEEAVQALFARLDQLDERLAQQRFLVGETLTVADIRLFTTLVRFDTVYAVHFKCNRRRVVDYPNLWGWLRECYQRPGFGDTTDFDHIIRHYYLTHQHLNPGGIVPVGPDLDWAAPHGRDRVG
ncbi:MAG: glutathione S-transferase family protein [Euzebyales bacterium]|jgi:putative glutathione S-transferase|nr:glutathione S-transferase family protein [Euzebyales bacterium]